MTLRDQLVARTRAGDAAAFNLLVAALPLELPPAVRRRQRDVEIRALAGEIAALLPGASGRRVARLVAAAGARTEAGRATLGGGPGFAVLTSAEAAEIVARIAAVLEWAPTGRDGCAWPGARQCERIISAGGLSTRRATSAAIEVSRPPAQQCAIG